MFGSSFSHTSVYSRHNVLISTILMVVERLNATGTVSGRLRSNAQHVISVRKDDMIRQRQLRDGFLKAQDTSMFALVNQECQNTS